MSATRNEREDPLTARVRRVAEMVRQLRLEQQELRAELETARERIRQLESERGTVRQRVEHMLESIGG